MVVNTTRCSSGQFNCGPPPTYPQCIRDSWVCDGDRDCTNGADEAMCGMYYDLELHMYHTVQKFNWKI